MDDLLLHRPPWYVAGALIAFVVVGLMATINERIGVLGGFSQLVERAEGTRPSLGWKVWFLFGVIGGGTLYALFTGSWGGRASYTWLTDTIGPLGTGLLLVAGGTLIGFGAKTAGGCTSGNGIGGCGVGSRASYVATASFMGTAIAATLLVRWLV
jgi:uncharacterized membrane protein YedE/YeeE